MDALIPASVGVNTGKIESTPESCDLVCFIGEVFSPWLIFDFLIFPLLTLLLLFCVGGFCL